MILKIYSEIVPEADRQFLQFIGLDGVSFNSIDEFISSIPEDDDIIDMRLNSPGGVVSEGWGIIDKLRATGKKIVATIEGQASSMASLILLAASERKAYKHATLLIHEAYYPAFTLADSYHKEDLDKLAQQLEEDNQRALDFMVERTGADRAELEAIMKEDRPMNMERAKELGFIHEILEPVSASAKGWNRPTLTNSNDMDKKMTLATAFKAIAEALGLGIKMEADPAPVGYALTAQDGTEINIEKPEGEDPAVGDAASPDGEHLMTDGTTIVIADGVITEIRDAEEPETEPEAEPETEDSATDYEAALAAKDEEIASLKARIAELEAGQMTAEQKDIVAKVEKAGGAAWLEKSLKSNYKPAARERKDQTVQPKANKIADDLAAAKAKKAAKTKKA